MAKPTYEKGTQRCEHKEKHFIIRRAHVKRPNSLSPPVRPSQKWREKFKLMFDQYETIAEESNDIHVKTPMLSPFPPTPPDDFPPTPSFPLNCNSNYDQIANLFDKMQLEEGNISDVSIDPLPLAYIEREEEIFVSDDEDDPPPLIYIEREEEIFVSDDEEAIDIACHCTGITKDQCLCEI